MTSNCTLNRQSPCNCRSIGKEIVTFSTLHVLVYPIAIQRKPEAEGCKKESRFPRHYVVSGDSKSSYTRTLKSHGTSQRCFNSLLFRSFIQCVQYSACLTECKHPKVETTRYNTQHELNASNHLHLPVKSKRLKVADCQFATGSLAVITSYQII